MEHVKQVARIALENKYILCSLAFLAIVGPGIVKLSAMLQALQH